MSESGLNRGVAIAGYFLNLTAGVMFFWLIHAPLRYWLRLDVDVAAGAALSGVVFAQFRLSDKIRDEHPRFLGEKLDRLHQ